jgi:thioredoxin-related protein
MKQAIAPTVLALVVAVIASRTNADTLARPGSKKNELFSHSNLQQAWQTAVTKKRPLLVLFTTEKCHYCEKMMAETYRHPAIIRLLRENAETVKVDARHYSDLVEQLGIRGFPTTLLVSPEGKTLEVIQGYTNAKTFAQRMSPLLHLERVKGDKKVVQLDISRTYVE